MNNRRRSEILIRSIDSFFKHQDRDIQEIFHKHILEICRKEKVSLEKVFSVLYFAVFVVGVFIIIYGLLCFTITNPKLKHEVIFIIAMEYSKRKSEEKIA